MKMQGITSKPTQAEKKRLKSLLSKKGRLREKQFLAEGVRLLEESLRHEFRPVRIYFSATLIGGRGQQLLDRFQENKIPIQELTARDIRRISGTESSQGLVGLFDIPERGPDDMRRGLYKKILLLDRVSDPGNAGALLRSALAFEFDLVFATEDTVELYNPKVVRSSVGAVFGIPVITGAPDDIAEFKRHQNCTIIVTDPRGGHIKAQLKKLKVKKSYILAIGSEAEGISSELRSLADLSIRIGHSDRVESLNAAVAGSILMKEIYDLTPRRRRQ